MRHSSCRSAEPGPYQTPALVTAPVLQRTTPRRGGALRCVRGTAEYLPRHHLPDPLRQVVEVERFCDHLHAGLQEALGDGDVLGIAGDEKDFQAGSGLAGLIGELAAV